MIEFILIIVFFAMIGLASLNWSLIQAIITENERQARERTYLSEQRENKLNETETRNEKKYRKHKKIIR